MEDLASPREPASPLHRRLCGTRRSQTAGCALAGDRRHQMEQEALTQRAEHTQSVNVAETVSSFVFFKTLIALEFFQTSNHCHCKDSQTRARKTFFKCFHLLR